MDVRTVLESPPSNRPIEVTGWLAIINNELYLLEENLREDYKESFKIKITEKSIIYALRGAVLPLHGGESFVFHKAKLIGYVNINPVPEICVEKLYIQERGETEMISVDINKGALDTARKRYEAVLAFDFLKEMGDR